MTTIEQSFLGSWRVSFDGTGVGIVHGDFAAGFIAEDQHEHVLGHYPTYERAIYALLHNEPARLHCTQ